MIKSSKKEKVAQTFIKEAILPLSKLKNNQIQINEKTILDPNVIQKYNELNLSNIQKNQLLFAANKGQFRIICADTYTEYLQKDIVSMGFPGSQFYVEDLIEDKFPGRVKKAIGFCLESPSYISLTSQEKDYEKLVYCADFNKVIKNNIPAFKEDLNGDKINAISLDWPGNLCDSKVQTTRRLLNSGLVDNRAILIQAFTSAHPCVNHCNKIIYIHTKNGPWGSEYMNCIIEVTERAILNNTMFRSVEYFTLKYKVFEKSHFSYCIFSLIERR